MLIFNVRRLASWVAVAIVSCALSRLAAELPSSYWLSVGQGENVVSATAALACGGVASIYLTNPGQDLLRAFASSARLVWDRGMLGLVVPGVFLALWAVTHGLHETVTISGTRNFFVGLDTALIIRLLWQTPGYAGLALLWVFPALMPRVAGQGSIWGLPLWAGEWYRDGVLSVVLFALSLLLLRTRSATYAAH